MISQYNDKVVKIIHNHLPGSKVYLFGLRLKDHEYFDLEMDIAIDAGVINDFGVIGNIYADIKKQLLPIDVKIVDLNNMSAEFRDKILKKAVILHKIDI